ncbi:MAG: ABC transporter ATP-binding protein [Bacteroidales bacterium]|nr:ABC transporter ATP-binding protein [Bacteroidales bacterium]
MNNPVVTIRNLRKSFGEKANKNEVLKGIDLSIYNGQIIGYIGPNGAGKSTTVKILSGIIDDYEGDIEVFGLPLKTNAIDIKRRIGYVPENGALYDLLTPREYLRFIGALYELPQKNCDVRMSQFFTFFDMNNVADQRMDTFSKGMKQKVLIMGGLINNPDILFLDEPLSGLDANSVILVKQLLQMLASEGKTIFYSSHLMDVVEKISDRIVLINNGVVIADGTFEQLKNENAETLENLFAQLTGNTRADVDKESLLSVFKN